MLSIRWRSRLMTVQHQVSPGNEKLSLDTLALKLYVTLKRLHKDIKVHHTPKALKTKHGIKYITQAIVVAYQDIIKYSLSFYEHICNIYVCSSLIRAQFFFSTLPLQPPQPWPPAEFLGDEGVDKSP